MKEPGLIFHFENEEDLEGLSAEEVGLIFLAMIEYSKTGKEPTFEDRALAFAFRPIKRRIDYDKQAYEERCRKNRENGAKGGRKPKETQKNQTVLEETQNNRMVISGGSKNPEEPKKPNTNTNTNTKSNTKSNSKDIITAPSPEKKIRLSSGQYWTITPEKIQQYKAVFPRVDVDHELDVMALTAEEQPDKRRAETRIEQFIVNWLRNADEKAAEQDKTAKEKAGAGQKKKNDFHNFKQHDYDFEAIERALYDQDFRDVKALREAGKI